MVRYIKQLPPIMSLPRLTRPNENVWLRHCHVLILLLDKLYVAALNMFVSVIGWVDTDHFDDPNSEHFALPLNLFKMSTITMLTAKDVTRPAVKHIYNILFGTQVCLDQLCR